MNKGAFRVVQDWDSAGGMATSTPNGSVFVNGNRAMVAPKGGHGAMLVDPDDKVDEMAEGSETVFCEGHPMCRVGDETVRGHAAEVGSEDVFVGG